jgi:hypothetical protein
MWISGKRTIGTKLVGEDHVGVLLLDGPNPTVKTYNVGDGYEQRSRIADEDVRTNGMSGGTSKGTPNH